MFLLGKPDQISPDGAISHTVPFMIRFDGDDVYAAFLTPDIARYFVEAARLDPDYRPIELVSISGELAEADRAYVFASRTQVYSVLRN